jgi:hypothetical protein
MEEPETRNSGRTDWTALGVALIMALGDIISAWLG